MKNILRIILIVLFSPIIILLLFGGFIGGTINFLVTGDNDFFDMLHEAIVDFKNSFK